MDDNLEEIALRKDDLDKGYLMDSFLPLDILRLFHGLEIHNLHRAFSKFKDGISLEAFVIISMRIIDIRKEDGPYALLGLINLYDSLTVKKNKEKLYFNDFLNNFIKMQSLSTENQAYVEEE